MFYSNPNIFALVTFVLLGARVTRVPGCKHAVLEHADGYLRSKPSEEKRRETGYKLRSWRECGTMVALVVGTGIKKLRDLHQSFSGRQSIRVVILCRFLG